MLFVYLLFFYNMFIKSFALKIFPIICSTFYEKKKANPSCKKHYFTFSALRCPLGLFFDMLGLFLDENWIKDYPIQSHLQQTFLNFGLLPYLFFADVVVVHLAKAAPLYFL